MTSKPEMIYGVFLGTIFIVITLNRASTFSCLMRGQSQYHANVSTLSGGRIRCRMDVLLVSRFDDYCHVGGGGGPWGGLTPDDNIE